jgi:hypothetical protein
LVGGANSNDSKIVGTFHSCFMKAQSHASQLNHYC